MQYLHRVRFHLIIALSILLGCLVPQASWAVSLKPGEGVKAPVSLSGHMSILRDPSGALSIDDVVSGRLGVQFEPLPLMLTEGYRKGAIWVRFSLSAPEASNRWLLQIERPLIERITLYVPDGTGRFVVSAPLRLHPVDGDGADAYPTVFPISVPSSGAEYYIRFQSATSITTSLNIWQSKGFEQYHRIDDWIIGIVVGAIGSMILANLLYAAWLKDSLRFLYSFVLFESGLMTLFHMGHASEVLYFLNAQSIHRIWGIIVCLYSIVMVLFLGKLFEFRRHQIFSWRILQSVALLNGVALMFAIAGRYSDVGFFVSRLEQISFIFIAVFVFYLLVVRRQHQYLLPAFAFMGVIIVSLVMQMQYTGTNPFRIDGSLARSMAVGTLIHLVLLSAAVAKRTQLAEQSLSEEKDRVIALSLSAERDLRIKVSERTAELAERNAALNAEMGRRHLLEVKLRQSLASVNDALAQQKEFVALVSHEFRAPLAVIAAAAENLSLSVDESADDIRSRAAKIRHTVRRMSMLIENVLAGDRLDAGPALPARIGMFDLNEILLATQAGLDDEAARRVSLVHDGEAMVVGDGNLLEIVVQNLIQNALKYSAAASSVTVRLSTDRGLAIVEVADNGVGVAPDDREFIFMKYHRVAGQQVAGSGLGLYIAREIARQHGGDLVLAASDASGSTFRFSLPVAGPRPDDPRSGRSMPHGDAGAQSE
jgi:signal transduction histidine kinase